MTEGARYLGPWCAECGYPAVEKVRSIDPRYPFGQCKRGKVGCKAGQLVPLVTTKDAGTRPMIGAGASSRPPANRQHNPDKLPEWYCDLCPHTLAEVEARDPGVNPTYNQQVAMQPKGGQ